MESDWATLSFSRSLLFLFSYGGEKAVGQKFLPNYVILRMAKELD
jgi:hypothetical protein